MSEKTILGVQLRRRIIGTVTGMGRADGVRVFFKGTRAYTNGKDIVLPAIKDLAEIPYSVARALIGFAIHEVGHVRYTDFEAILRAIEAGKMEPDKLIKKFENCIEDYRIEREISREFPGAPADLTALRIKIHPSLNQLSPEWMADPRACGPLALTWTGSLLNGFAIPEVMPTLNAFSPPIRALVDRWTRQMDGVATTEDAVDLAIAFAKEAMDYADASRDQSISSEPGDDCQEGGENDNDPDSGETDAENNDADNDNNDDDSAKGDQDNDVDAEADTTCENCPDEESDEDGEADASAGTDTNDQSQDGDATDSCDNSGDPSEAGNDNENQPGDPSQSDLGSSADSEASETGDQAGQGDATKSPADEPDHDGEKGSDGPTKNPSSPDNKSTSEKPASQGSRDQDAVNGDPSSSGAVGGGEGNSDPGGDRANGNDSADDSSTSTDQADSQSQNDNSPGDSPGDNAETNDGNSGTGSDSADSDANQDSGTSSAPFADVLDDDAAFDDFLDDLRDAIAEMPLPEDAPDATDGEVDPDEIIESIKEANDVAPNYTSPDPDPSDNPAEAGRGAAAHHYNDSRFVPVDQAGDEDSLLSAIMAEASGVIGTTARTIRRLLMAEEQKGTHRNRRDGSFDIRNISAIVRQTGTCYKKTWERPAPETHLTILGDFSGSMDCGNYDQNGKPLRGLTALGLSVTGMFAVNEATRNTSIETSIYGFAGYSPNVVLYAFKEGKQSQVATRRKIGNYGNLDLGCTPTGEAMVAVAELLEDVPQKRRILLMMTDGQADDPALCKGVISVLERRGVEVVAIGIKDDSVRKWCANSHVIQDLSELPQALLACIDPRGAKKALRKAA